MHAEVERLRDRLHAGSACHSGRTEPSAVLTAMGLDADRALAAVRLSLGYGTTAADVDTGAAGLAAAATVAEVGA